MRKQLLCLLLTFSLSTTLFSQITKETRPSWVNDVDYSKSEINLDDVTEGTHLLLFDNQVHIPNETVFYRLTTKITDNVGIQSASTINVSYDPSYQKLKFHTINIIRDGAIIDKLDVSNIQEMRRELNAENHLYDGSLSAVMNISDVRTDDIIDYSYSIKGFNPIHNNVFSDNFYLNDTEPVGKINVSIFSKNELKYKLFNTSKAPVISIVNNLFHYNWEVNNTEKLDYEDYTPSWKLVYESVFISEFNSWKQVVDWGVDIYKVNEKNNAKLQAKITEINATYKNNGDKIKATLDFVQDEIRYLGLESGIGGYKPFLPNQVLNQRFGDCKDKSLLMVAMLDKMNIEAYPMLVNTTLKHTIKDILPSAKFFDHCVVKVVNDKSDYYYDPTISNQGGDYDSTHFPNYEYGLVLKKGNDAFDEIKSSSENKIETLEEYTLEDVGKGAALKITTTYYESEADNMRNYFKNYSINAIDKEYTKFYSSYYFNVSSVNPPSFKDELDKNVFKVVEEYKIDSIWQPMIEKDKHIAVNFTATSLLNTLYVPKNDKRTSDLSIAYPLIREHRIKVKLPENWAISNDKLYVNSPGFYYEWKVDYSRKEKLLDLYYYLEPQKNHIKPEEYEQYIKDIKKVDQSTGYYIYIPEDYSSTSSSNNTSFFDGFVAILKFLMIVGIAICIVLLIFWALGRKKNA